MERIPVHLDFDTGIDDALALICALLCQDQIDILGISAVAGNVPLEYTARNTQNILAALGEGIPVVKGAEKPLARPLHCAVSHGKTGLGDVRLPQAQRAYAASTVEDAIYGSACKAEGGLVYFGAGPQTNLALALKKYPQLNRKIKRVVLMGGALVGGNMTQASEFNAYVDPEALRLVFCSGIPITMVGLDVTLQTKLPQWVADALRELSNPYARLAAQIIDFALRRSREYGFDAANVHDALAFCSIVFPQVLETHPYYVEVETQGRLTRGMTVADFRGVCPEKAPNADCAVKVDIDSFWNWLVSLFRREEAQFIKGASRSSQGQKTL